MSILFPRKQRNSSSLLLSTVMLLGITAATTSWATSTGAPGTGVFVDSINGNDSNPGTYDSPWKTLSRLSSIKLSAGQGVYLRCGSTFRGVLKLGANQLVDGSIIAGYGSNCATTKATVSGADDFSTGWSKSGAVWSRQLPATTPKITRLFINGMPLRTAQWPNYGGVGYEYAIARSTAPASNAILQVSSADAVTLTNKDLAGARVQIRSEHWYIESRTVGSFSPGNGSLTLTSSTQYAMEGGDGYVLQDKMWMLDAPGEFLHDTASGVLYVYPPDSATQANLNAALVEGAVRQPAMDIYSRPNLSLKNIAAVMSSGDGLLLSDTNGAVVDSVIAMHNQGAGVRITVGSAALPAQARSVVKNSVISDNWNTGVDTSNSPNTDVVANQIKDTGTLANAGWSAGAIIAGSGSVIDGNFIQNSAYHGIRYSGKGGSKLTNNVLRGHCLRLTDCGAIYTWNGPKGSQNVTNQTSSIIGNQIFGATPNQQGSMPAGPQVIAGIYLDDFSRGVSVQSNTVISLPYGIYLHNSAVNTVNDNKVWMMSMAALWARMDQSDADYMTGNIFQSNQLLPKVWATGAFPALPKPGVAVSVKFQHPQGAASITSGSNVFAYNQTVQLAGTTNPIATVGNGSIDASLFADDWLSLSPLDKAPRAPVTYRVFRATALGPELNTTGGFSTSIAGWKTWYAANSAGATASWIPNAGGCTGGCAQFTSGSASDMMYSPGFTLAAAATYQYSFNASLSGKAMLPKPYLTRDTTPWDPMVNGEGLVSSTALSGNVGDVIQYEAMFHAASNAQARVNLQVATSSVPVAFDSVSVRQVTGMAVSAMNEWAVADGATASAPKTVSCTSLGWTSGCAVMDVNSNSIAMPFTLLPGESRLFLRLDTPWKK